MSEKIESCFMDEQPDFYQKVEFEGQHIATLRAPSTRDFLLIHGIDKTRATGLLMICLLGGRIGAESARVGLEGWTFKDSEGQIRPVNEKNYYLLDVKYQRAIVDRYLEVADLWNKNKEGISKN